jgi:hypothetical protein
MNPKECPEDVYIMQAEEAPRQKRATGHWEEETLDFSRKD